MLSEVFKIAKTFVEMYFSRSHRFFEFFSLRHFEKFRKLAPLKNAKTFGKMHISRFSRPDRRKIGPRGLPSAF